MDLNEVKQVIDIFYTADADETGGLDKKELERALARVLNVFVVPAKDVETAWENMIGKRPVTLETIIAEVSIDAFFHWYVENVGSRLVSRSIRRRPSLVTELTSSASESAVTEVASKLPPAVQRQLPEITRKAFPDSPLTPSTRPSTSTPKSESQSPEMLPTISADRAGTWSSKQRPRPVMTSVLRVPAEPASPLTPSTQMSEPLSPCTPPAAPAMSHDQVEALRQRFNRFAEGSGV